VANNIDVLIIGAGASGLMAANVCANASLHAVVLEARDRIGGRVFTETNSAWPVPVELGAEFIHGMPPEIWDLAGPSNLRIKEKKGDRWMSRDGKLQVCNDMFDEIGEVLENLEKCGDPDRSFAKFLSECHPPVSPQAQRSAIAYVEGFNAAEADRVSVQWLIEGQRAADKIEGDRLFQIANGYIHLPESIRSGLDPALVQIHTECPVESIRWERGSVTVQSGAASWEARRAIITVPLSILQADTIRFLPAIPEKVKTAQRLIMGKVIRITLLLREKIWPPNMTLLLSEDPIMPTWWTSVDSEAPVITGWASGRKAEPLSFLSPDQVRDQAVKALARVLKLDPAKVAENTLAYYTHDWQADPFSQGAYSYVPAGSVDAPFQLAQPIENTLFFAGEATNYEGHSGTVHGALQTGSRAAHQAIRSLAG
jgi:monoamine oxidase